MGICSRKNKNKIKALLKGTLIKSLGSDYHQLGREQWIGQEYHFFTDRCKRVGSSQSCIFLQPENEQT